MSEPTWLTADLGAASDLSPPSRRERMRHSPQNAHGKEDDGKDPLLILSLVLQGPGRTTSCCSGDQKIFRIFTLMGLICEFCFKPVRL